MKTFNILLILFLPIAVFLADISMVKSSECFGDIYVENNLPDDINYFGVSSSSDFIGWSNIQGNGGSESGVFGWTTSGFVIKMDLSYRGTGSIKIYVDGVFQSCHNFYASNGSILLDISSVGCGSGWISFIISPYNC